MVMASTAAVITMAALVATVAAAVVTGTTAGAAFKAAAAADAVRVSVKIITGFGNKVLRKISHFWLNVCVSILLALSIGILEVIEPLI